MVMSKSNFPNFLNFPMFLTLPTFRANSSRAL